MSNKVYGFVCKEAIYERPGQVKNTFVSNKNINILKLVLYTRSHMQLLTYMHLPYTTLLI